MLTKQRMNEMISNVQSIAKEKIIMIKPTIIACANKTKSVVEKEDAFMLRQERKLISTISRGKSHYQSWDELSIRAADKCSAAISGAISNLFKQR